MVALVKAIQFPFLCRYLLPFIVVGIAVLFTKKYFRNLRVKNALKPYVNSRENFGARKVAETAE